MQINRRFFLFGTAATLAAAALPEIVNDLDAEADALPEQIFTAQISSPARGLRRVHYIEFGAIRRQESDSVLDFKVFRRPGDDLPLIAIQANARANVLWKAAPGGELLFPHDTLMVVDVTGVASEVIVTGDDDDGSFVERFNFDGAVTQVERFALEA